MGILTFTDEYTSPVPASRLFKALIVDSHNLIPKIMPQVVKSIDIVEGDGGPGSIRKVNFNEGSEVDYVINRVDDLDLEEFIYKYTLIEGGPIKGNLESISYSIRFEVAPKGGSKNKMTSTYYIEGDYKLQDEEIKAGKDKVLAMYIMVEEYLLQNPDAYI